jgi:hypothetical protein
MFRSPESLPQWRRLRRALVLLTGAAILSIPARAAAQSFDHSAFDRLLRTHVTAEGWVDYDAFARSGEFRTYLDALGRAEIASSPPRERLALWINAYNAYTIMLINKHEERASIRNINRARLHQGEGSLVRADRPRRGKDLHAGPN